MKKGKKTFKLSKYTYAIYALLIFVIIGLIIYIFANSNNKDISKKYSQIKVNNNLGDSTACKSNILLKENINITIKFCGNGEVVVLDNSISEDASSEETNNKKSKTSKLNIQNVVNFYSTYSYTESLFTYYILTSDGKVYITDENNIINKKYDVNLIEGLESIVILDEYITYENNTNIYTNDLYAVDQDGKLHFLKNIY